MPLAKDLVRSHTCAIFDILKEAYSHTVNTWEWEQEIADEAIQIAYACWSNFRELPRASFSAEALRTDITTHVGHPLRSGPLPRLVETPAPIDSPLLSFIKASRDARPQVFAPISPPTVELKEEDVPAPSEFASELKKRMIEARLTAEALADKVNIDCRTVYRHLSGAMSPSPTTLGVYEAVLSRLLKQTITLPTPVRRQKSTKTSGKRQ
jgi:hypothetical protein